MGRVAQSGPALQPVNHTNPYSGKRGSETDNNPEELTSIEFRGSAFLARSRRHGSEQLLSGKINMVLALHQAARIMPSRYVTEPNVAR
jgi:hypothetical protein